MLCFISYSAGFAKPHSAARFSTIFKVDTDLFCEFTDRAVPIRYPDGVPLAGQSVKGGHDVHFLVLSERHRPFFGAGRQRRVTLRCPHRTNFCIPWAGRSGALGSLRASRHGTQTEASRNDPRRHQSDGEQFVYAQRLERRSCIGALCARI